MYKSFTATGYKKHLNLPEDYVVDAFVAYGTFRSYPYDMLELALKSKGYAPVAEKLDHDLFSLVRVYKVGDKTLWFMTAYGGALLSEVTHLASLFGSKMNVLIGSCGGLKKGASSQDLIVPTLSYSEDSSAKIYSSVNEQYADEKLSSVFRKMLESNFVIHEGPIMTCQAMLGETKEHIDAWENSGFIGVEMEAATVFAVSKHFGVPAVALLRIGDNLIENMSVMDDEYKNSQQARRDISQQLFDAVAEIL